MTFSSTNSVVLCVLLAVSLAVGQTNWDRVVSPAVEFTALPLTASAAENSGWTTLNGECNPNLGIAFVQGSIGRLTPRTLYYTAAGQIAGVGMTIWSTPPPQLQGYWVQQPDSSWQVTVSFRNASLLDLCSQSSVDSGNAVGDALIVAQSNVNFSIPLTDQAALDAGWTNGSCITTMGRHWAWDVAGNMTWQIDNLMPVMPMYSNGVLVTFLINTPTTQVPQPLGQWDVVFPTYLPGDLPCMCANFCGCQYRGLTTVFSVVHFFLTDVWQNKCESIIPGNTC